MGLLCGGSPQSGTRVVDYALSEIPREKIWMGMPNYGYDWKVPYQKDTMARSISNQQAIALAQKYYAAIRFDEAAQSPWFRYVDGDGQEHEVWFEDARSVRAKLELGPQSGTVRGELLESHAPLPPELGSAHHPLRNPRLGLDFSRNME